MAILEAFWAANLPNVNTAIWEANLGSINDLERGREKVLWWGHLDFGQVSALAAAELVAIHLKDDNVL
jgi:hypothetical protein